MNMEEKFNEIIREELPEKVGAELREVLENYEKLKVEHSRVLTARERDTKEISRLQDITRQQGDKIQTTDKLLDDYRSREADLVQRETKIEVAMLRVELEASQRVEGSLTNFMSSVTQNNTYRKQVYGSKDIHIPAIYDTNGYQSTPDQTKTLNFNESETIEQD
jgi:hypothetical protein